VVGIVAARLVDRFARPSLVIALEGATGRGSARSPGRYHLYQALHAVEDLLIRHGGHEAAAGLTIATENVPELRRRLNESFRAATSDTTFTSSLTVDAEVQLDAIDELLAEEVGRMEPFGVGNPEPILAVRGATLERARVVGERHLQVTLRDGLHARDGIGFWLADRDPGSGTRVHAAFVPEVDTWQGRRRLRVRLRDLHPDAHIRQGP
jgi:single-stranded-DNA-specific exonuclease